MQEKEKAAGKGQKRKLVSGTSSQSSKRLSGLTDLHLVKQTIAVVIITVILAVIISVMDSAILEGINLLMK